MKKILVPVDGSDSSKKAARQAVDIARKYAGSVTFLAVAEPAGEILFNAYGDGMTETEEFLVIRDALTQRRMEKYSKLLDDLVEELECADLVVEKQTVEGSPHPAIVDAARQGQHDLIVMGHRGMNPLKRIFIGSVAKRVIEDSPCSVLIVK